MWVHNGSPELDAQSDFKKIMGALIPLTVIMTIIVSLRAYVRFFIVKAVGFDDWIIFYSALATILYNGVSIGGTRWGLGLPIAIRPKEDLGEFTKLNFVGRPFYMTGILGFKLAMCIAYLRILPRYWTNYRRAIFLVIAACTAGHLGGLLVLFFQCSPIKKAWEPSVNGTCLPNLQTFHALAAITIIFDVIILFLPMPILSSLQISPRRKVALMGIFSLGIFTTFCSIMRMVQISAKSYGGNQTMLVVWACVEMNVGVSLTCLPTLTPLLKYYQDRSKDRSNGYEVYGSSADIKATPLRAVPQKRRTNPSTQPTTWQDDSSSFDNVSQKNILGKGALETETEQEIESCEITAVTTDDDRDLERNVGEHRDRRSIVDGTGDGGFMIHAANAKQ